MKLNIVKNILQNNTKNINIEFKRLFHGRGNVYENLEFLTIDSIDNILFVAFYSQIDIEFEKKLLDMLKEYILTSRHNTIVLQRRYIAKTTATVIAGIPEDDLYIVENNLKLKINLLSNQNTGYFPDMKIGREFVKNNAKNKKVLNLFSYTCAFSVFAISGGATSVTNFDMAKGALTTGRANHHLNNQETKNIKFYPHNILKSFSKIKKESPYDLIIIDPPTFQKGSFEATKDYDKIIKRLEDISSKDCIVLACLNSPSLTQDFIIELFAKLAPSFKYIKRLENVKEFEAIDEQRSLKNLVFQRVL